MAAEGDKTAVGVLYPRDHVYVMGELPKELERKSSSFVIVAEAVVHRTETGELHISPEDIANLQKAELIITDPHVFRKLGLDLPRLKWLHSYYAGVEPLTRHVVLSNEIPSYILTRNGCSFTAPMAEYVLMYILANERNLTQIYEQQKSRIWKMSLYRDMSTLTLGILGLGAIGKETARLAKSVGMKVWGLVRNIPSTKSDNVDEYRLVGDLPELLSSCDYICAILPSTAETDGLLNGDMLSHCKNKKSVFVNIGRGNIVKNATILKALEEGWISRAILDVFETEPLPADSELWSHPRVTVTPHVAGVGLEIEKFVDDYILNFEHYKKVEPMNHVVDWSAGY